MSNRLPRIKGEVAVKAFCRYGYVVDRTHGSHYILCHPAGRPRLTIPVHAGRTIGIGLLVRQIKAAGLTIEQFLELL